VQRNLSRSQAPYWAATEWLLQDSQDAAAWRQALVNTLAEPHCRYLCIFNWESIRSNAAALEAIAGLIDQRDSTPASSDQ